MSDGSVMYPGTGSFSQGQSVRMSLSFLLYHTRVTQPKNLNCNTFSW